MRHETIKGPVKIAPIETVEKVVRTLVPLAGRNSGAQVVREVKVTLPRCRFVEQADETLAELDAHLAQRGRS